jgi:hypothetical protein
MDKNTQVAGQPEPLYNAYTQDGRCVTDRPIPQSQLTEATKQRLTESVGGGQPLIFKMVLLG